MVKKHMAVGSGVFDLIEDRLMIIDHLDQFRDDTNFLESIRPELQNQYPNRWVGIYQRRVVGTGATLKEVIRKLDEKGVPKSRAVIDFLRTEALRLIL